MIGAVGELEVDLARHLLRLSDEPVHLTPKEYDLLTALATRPAKAPVAALAPARGVGAGPVDRAIRLSWDTGVGMDAVLVADARDVALHIVLGDEVVA
ncbi:MAG: hypothetical protein ACXVP7_02120 [Actinomycetota bacterium]